MPLRSVRDMASGNHQCGDILFLRLKSQGRRRENPANIDFKTCIPNDSHASARDCGTAGAQVHAQCHARNGRLRDALQESQHVSKTEISVQITRQPSRAATNEADRAESNDFTAVFHDLFNFINGL